MNSQPTNIDNLTLINQMEIICNQNGSNEFVSSGIEKAIFDNGKYLEENSFATSCQLVSVYGMLELKCKNRSE